MPLLEEENRRREERWGAGRDNERRWGVEDVEELMRKREEELEEEAMRSSANLDYVDYVGQMAGMRRRSTFRSVSESPK